MMRHIWKLFVSSMVFLVPISAHAEPSTDEILKKIDDGEETAKLVLYYMQRGASWSNVALASKTKRRLYCVPDKLEVTEDQVVSILKQYRRHMPISGDWPAGMTLMFALEYTFPCSDELRISGPQ